LQNFPAVFVNEHMRRGFRPDDEEEQTLMVKLEGVPGGLTGLTVRCKWHFYSDRNARFGIQQHYGCREFMERNGLSIGQALKFSLIADKHFIVALQD
jgi:hypothetical protein